MLLIIFGSVLGIAVAIMAAAYSRRRVLYHYWMKTQIASELSQTPFNEPPLVELVVARAMADTKLDILNHDGSNDRSDFDDNVRACLKDAWTAPVHGVFRKFMLDNVTIDIGRRMRLMDAIVTDKDILNVKLPKLIVITSALPYSGSRNLLQYFIASPSKFYVPSLSDIRNITPGGLKVPVATSFSNHPPPKPIIETLVKRFASKFEKLNALDESDFRFDCSAYLNCTFHDLISFGRFSLPTLSATSKTNKIQTVQLLKLILQVHVASLQSVPEYIVLEGHEHSLYVETLAQVFGNIKVVVVDVAGEDFLSIVRTKLSFQIRALRSLILGKPSTSVDGNAVQKAVEAEKERLDLICKSLGTASVLKVDGNSLISLDPKAETGKRGVVDVIGDRVMEWLTQ
ncbi:hypothetical protein BDR26DRAFT_914533 [Obelidium mucronatum]|nr:hypothetical protein BDR26DRAFT_914533 [Obelidium mucronatum]